ncbi:hypothetical protein ACA910_011526 [Epithemia clementina (nom. ined.)]
MAEEGEDLPLVVDDFVSGVLMRPQFPSLSCSNRRRSSMASSNNSSRHNSHDLLLLLSDSSSSVYENNKQQQAHHKTDSNKNNKNNSKKDEERDVSSTTIFESSSSSSSRYSTTDDSTREITRIHGGVPFMIPKEVQAKNANSSMTNQQMEDDDDSNSTNSKDEVVQITLDEQASVPNTTKTHMMTTAAKVVGPPHISPSLFLSDADASADKNTAQVTTTTSFLFVPDNDDSDRSSNKTDEETVEAETVFVGPAVAAVGVSATNLSSTAHFETKDDDDHDRNTNNNQNTTKDLMTDDDVAVVQTKPVSSVITTPPAPPPPPPSPPAKRRLFGTRIALRRNSQDSADSNNSISENPRSHEPGHERLAKQLQPRKNPSAQQIANEQQQQQQNKGDDNSDNYDDNIHTNTWETRSNWEDDDNNMADDDTCDDNKSRSNEKRMPLPLPPPPLLPPSPGAVVLALPENKDNTDNDEENGNIDKSGSKDKSKKNNSNEVEKAQEEHQKAEGSTDENNKEEKKNKQNSELLLTTPHYNEGESEENLKDSDKDTHDKKEETGNASNEAVLVEEKYQLERQRLQRKLQAQHMAEQQEKQHEEDNANLLEQYLERGTRKKKERDIFYEQQQGKEGHKQQSKKHLLLPKQKLSDQEGPDHQKEQPECHQKRGNQSNIQKLIKAASPNRLSLKTDPHANKSNKRATPVIPQKQSFMTPMARSKRTITKHRPGQETSEEKSKGEWNLLPTPDEATEQNVDTTPSTVPHNCNCLGRALQNISGLDRLVNPGIAALHVAPTTGKLNKRYLTLSKDRLALFITPHPIAGQGEPSGGSHSGSNDGLLSTQRHALTALIMTTANASPLNLLRKKERTVSASSFAYCIDVADWQGFQVGVIGTQTLERARTVNRMNGQDDPILDTHAHQILTLWFASDASAATQYQRKHSESLNLLIANAEDRQLLVQALSQIYQAYHSMRIWIPNEALLLRREWYNLGDDSNNSTCGGGGIGIAGFVTLLQRINFPVPHVEYEFQSYWTRLDGERRIRAYNNKDDSALEKEEEAESDTLSFSQVMALLQELKRRSNCVGNKEAITVSDMIWNSVFGPNRDSVSVMEFGKDFLHKIQGMRYITDSEVEKLVARLRVMERHWYGLDADLAETEMQQLQSSTFVDTDRTSSLEMTRSRFELYLMDPMNSAYNPRAVQGMTSEGQNKDLNRPLSHYWINSSHSTYLTGDQTGATSIEMYLIALRRGCKYLELDCWDGNTTTTIRHEPPNPGAVASSASMKDKKFGPPLRTESPLRAISCLRAISPLKAISPRAKAFPHRYDGRRSPMKASSPLSAMSPLRQIASKVRGYDTQYWPVVHNRAHRTNDTEPKILFADVIRAVKAYIQHTNPETYPIILSLENHCSFPFQQTMLRDLKEILGDMLYIPTKEARQALPSPQELIGKVVLLSRRPTNREGDEQKANHRDDKNEEGNKTETDHHEGRNSCVPPKLVRELARCILCDDVGSINVNQSISNNATSKMYSMSATEVARLLNEGKGYGKPVNSSDDANISSTFADSLRFSNLKHLTRTYTSIRGADTFNCNPTLAWAVGCQLVSLNMHTPDTALVLNDGRFRENQLCGYVIKESLAKDSRPQDEVTFKNDGGTVSSSLHAEVDSKLVARDVPQHALPKAAAQAEAAATTLTQNDGGEKESKTRQSAVISDPKGRVNRILAAQTKYAEDEKDEGDEDEDTEGPLNMVSQALFSCWTICGGEEDDGKHPPSATHEVKLGNLKDKPSTQSTNSDDGLSSQDKPKSSDECDALPQSTSVESPLQLQQNDDDTERGGKSGAPSATIDDHDDSNENKTLDDEFADVNGVATSEAVTPISPPLHVADNEKGRDTHTTIYSNPPVNVNPMRIRIRVLAGSCLPKLSLTSQTTTLKRRKEDSPKDSTATAGSSSDAAAVTDSYFVTVTLHDVKHILNGKNKNKNNNGDDDYNNNTNEKAHHRLTYVSASFDTNVVDDNGFCPSFWTQDCSVDRKEMHVNNPQVAMLQFTLKQQQQQRRRRQQSSQQMTTMGTAVAATTTPTVATASTAETVDNDNSAAAVVVVVVAEAAIPCHLMRPGYRSIPLYDPKTNTRTGIFGFGSLLVELQIANLQSV